MYIGKSNDGSCCDLIFLVGSAGFEPYIPVIISITYSLLAKKVLKIKFLPESVRSDFAEGMQDFKWQLIKKGRACLRPRL